MTEDSGHEDVGALRRQLEETRSAQSGSDRRVQELTEANRSIREELDSYKSGSNPEVQRLKQKAESLEIKERAFRYSLEKGIDPKMAFDLLGFEAAEVEDRIDQIAGYEKSIRLEERNKYAKLSGRTIHKTSLPGLPGSYGELHHVPDEQLQQMGAAVDSVMEHELKTKRPTLRNRIKGGKG